MESGGGRLGVGRIEPKRKNTHGQQGGDYRGEGGIRRVNANLKYNKDYIHIYF